MNLLLKRDQKEHKFSAPTFGLWAKFELTKEEAILLHKYKPNHAMLSEDEPQSRQRKWRKALIAGGILAFLIGTAVLFWLGAPFLAAGAWIGSWLILTFLIFAQIREDILVNDILTGRRFHCKSVVTLLEKEHILTEMAEKFHIPSDLVVGQ